MKQAIGLALNGQTDEASDKIAQALDISPAYFEVKRVEAMLRVEEGNIPEAEAAYEAAVSLAPQRAPLRMWFGGFISRHLGDHPRAIEQLLMAEQLAPAELYIKLELARVYQYQRLFNEAEQKLLQVSSAGIGAAKQRRIMIDLMIQNETRRAEFLLSEGENISALKALEKGKNIFDDAPATLIDIRAERNIQRAGKIVPALIRALKGLPEQGRAEEVIAWLKSPLAAKNLTKTEIDSSKSDSDVKYFGPTNKGVLSGLQDNYGFIQNDQERIFFHRGDWTFDIDFTRLGDGAAVEYERELRPRGPYAVNIRPLSRPNFAKANILLKGVVLEKKRDVAKIKCDDGRIIKFSSKNCVDGTSFRLIFIGERMRFKVRRIRNQDIAYDVESYSGI